MGLQNEQVNDEESNSFVQKLVGVEETWVTVAFLWYLQNSIEDISLLSYLQYR